MKVAIGADHGGFALKEYIKTIPICEWIDVGTYDTNSVDYPDYAKSVSELILKNEADYGILICKSGIGVSIAANRFHGIYAALCFNQDMAKSARSHNNSNVLCLAAEYLSDTEAKHMVEIFLSTLFSDEARHALRLEKIDRIC